MFTCFVDFPARFMFYKELMTTNEMQSPPTGLMEYQFWIKGLTFNIRFSEGKYLHTKQSRTINVADVFIVHVF